MEFRPIRELMDRGGHLLFSAHDAEIMAGILRKDNGCKSSFLFLLSNLSIELSNEFPDIEANRPGNFNQVDDRYLAFPGLIF